MIKNCSAIWQIAYRTAEHHEVADENKKTLKRNLGARASQPANGDQGWSRSVYTLLYNKKIRVNSCKFVAILPTTHTMNKTKTIRPIRVIRCHLLGKPTIRVNPC
jgi:hypothetical protein